MKRSRLSVPVLVALCACSGGGGGTPHTAPTAPGATATPTSPGATATPTPAATPTPGTTTGTSVYHVTSVPAGLRVTVTHQSATQNLTTPATVQPGASNFATTIAIEPSNGAAAYSIAVDQHGGGAQTMLYNQSADTSGSIGTIAPLASVRRPFVRRADATGVPRFAPLRAAGRPAFSDRDVIVTYRAGADRDAAERELGVTRAHDLRIGANPAAFRVLDVPAGTTADGFALRLRARPEVATVQRDVLYYKETTTPVIANDTYFNDYDQWDLFDIATPNAWGYTEGSPSVQIAMIDTGIDATSPDFAGAKIGHAESIIDGTVTMGLSAVQDTDGHGTNTAGIAAAATDDGFGFAGTGFNTGLQIYKVFPDDTAANKYSSTANSSDVVAAIEAAIAAGARVINLSLGSCQAEQIDTAQEAAVEDAISHGVVVVAAAGNERSGTSSDSTCGGGSSTIDYPAAYPGVISVGASALNDAADPANPATATEYVASYSNSGPGLSLVAPGGDPSAADMTATNPDVLHWIYNLYTTTAANPNEQCSNKSNCTALFAGTSQATPHVSGAAALMLAKNGNLSPAQVKQILISTADDIDDPNQGNGRLDAYRALAAVDGDAHPPAAPSNLNFVAIAYVPNGTNRPQILDVTYPNGVPVARNGTFRVADVPAGSPAYKIGVWYDANGDGVVDTGDYFGSSQTCSASAPCTSAANLVASPVTSGFVLQ
jgi:subtilisin family serine protease